MPINSFLYPAPSTPTFAYNVANSLRFERSSSDYLSKTFGSGGNRKTATQSFWMKRSLLSTNMMAGLTTTASGSYYGIQIMTDDVLDIYLYYSGSAWEGRLKTNRVFRDTNAWYHFVLAWDTTQSTASNRFKLYVNGVQETSFQVETYPNQNQDLDWNNNIAHQIMSGGGGTFSGYLAEFVFIDGQALDPTSFGEFDSDSPTIWKPKDVSGLTFGTNGFYLDFENASSLGADVSGNSNNFTVNNLTSVDQSIDSCTNNFSTINSLNTFPSNPPTLSEGNLQCRTINADPGYFGGSGTIGVSTGKWYFEVKPTVSTSGVPFLIGVSYDPAEAARQGTTASAQYSASEYVYYGHNGNKANSGSFTSYGNSYAVDDIIGVALDLDNHKIYFSKNGTFQNSGDPTTGSTGTGSAFDLTTGQTYFPFLSDGGGSVCTYQCNFGSPPYAISSGNADANGFGNFEYAVPSGYFSLCSKNLAEFG